jgi:periplasmic divalent cation tolerance protein
VTALLEVHTAFPDEESALSTARILVQEQLAACVQIIPGVTSIYRWEGMLRHDSEHLALMKTSAACWPELRDRLIELHPYDIPEIIAMAVEQASFEYSNWVRDSVRA